MQEQSCSAVTISPARLVRSLAFVTAVLGAVVAPTNGVAQSAPKPTAPNASVAGAVKQTITFRQPRVTGRGRMALHNFAKKIAPGKNQSYRLEHVDVDVYVNPNADDFTRTAAANMSNEVARRLSGWGVPRDKISRSTQAKERNETKAGTYDVELNATGSGP